MTSKQGTLDYQGCEISWRVYGQGNQFGAKAFVTVHAEDTVVQEIASQKIYPSLIDAEADIITQAKNWIDEQLELGRFIPIQGKE